MGNWLYRYQVAAWEEAPYIVNWNSKRFHGAYWQAQKNDFGELRQGP